MSESDHRSVIIKRKPEATPRTKPQLSLEVAELQTRLEAAEQRLQEANEGLQAQIAERRRAEEIFTSAQEYTESIVETIREPFIVLTPDLKVISANRSFYETFQVAPEETEGRFIFDVGNHQWDIPALRELLKAIIAHNAPPPSFNNFEVDHAFPRIGRKKMLLNARRIVREGSGMDRILLAFEDITDQKQTEESLNISEKRYRRLFETAQDGILILDAETGQIADVNPFLVKMLGYSHEDFLGKRLWELGFFKDIEVSKAAFSELQSTGYVRYHDLPLETKDGRPIAVEFVSNVYLVNSHKVIQCNIRDITDQKQTEESLNISERRYRRLFETAQDGILILDAETGQIADVNPFLVALLGYSHKDFLGKKLWEIGAFKDIEASKAIFLKLQEKGYVRYEDLPLETNDGRPIAVEFVSNVYLVNSHKVIQCNIRDITDRKHLKEALQESHDELERRVEERTVELQTALAEIKIMKDQLEAENLYFLHENKMKHRFEHILGQSDGLKYVLYRAEQVAPTNTTVLILGETGTGKELIAYAIHDMSPRKERPLITVNCAALPGNLIESELFGREKGAFTGADTRQVGRFEIAHGSTLCLDEIGELPLELQAKLLRVLQHYEFERLGSSQTIKVDVRIVATTNRNLEEEVRNGTFRQDLYYRLNVFPITVPPLRQRKEDIPLMVQAFIERYSKKLGKRITSISKETMKTLQEYPWPGNVRELESIIERAAILCPGPVLQLTDKLEIPSPSLSTTVRTLEGTERVQILKMLSEAGWHIEGKAGAAAILGIHPSTLRARMHKLGIVRPETKEPG